MNFRRLIHLLAVVTLLGHPSAARAQSPTTARLMLTVVDPSGGVLPKATVTVTGIDPGTKSAAIKPAVASDKGVATIEGLAPGRYTVHAEFTGFQPGVLKEVQLKAGDNKHVLVLALPRVESTVTVAQDPQSAAADPRGNAFRTRLTAEEINALSDDPAEMARQLMELAGGNAVFRIDGFSGGTLPPKAMIKSIHIVRDTFAAENHSAEADEIDIITQPGVGPFRGGLTTRFRDGSMSGKSQFVPQKGPERSQNYQGNIGGTVVPEKSSFAFSGTRGSSFDTPNLYASLPDGTRAEALRITRPVDTWSVYGLFDYALTRDHTLRMAYEGSSSIRRNLGVGGYDLPERAYSTDSNDGLVRIQETGPLGRRQFLTTRLEVQWTNSLSKSVLEAPTVRVTDSATRGGAQVRGGSQPREFEFASDLDYVRGMQSIRTGVLVEGGYYRSNDEVNYLGTFLFTSEAAFAQGQPASYTRRVGDPLIQYWNVRAGAYFQDDLRVAKSLTISPGVRYEAQTHVDDRSNVAPRIGLTWAPLKSGRTTVRFSYGLFYGWLNRGTYEQTLRVDGFRQQELLIADPTYPDPGPIGALSTGNRYLLGNVDLLHTLRLSAGVDQTLTKKLQVSALFSDTRGSDVLYGVNLNAPVGGVRPDPDFANVIETVSGGKSHTKQLTTTLALNLAGGNRAASLGRVNWLRETIRFTYWLSKAENDTDGAFAVSPTGTLATEWGPAPNDRRHRFSLSLNSQTLKNLNTSLTLAANTGTPYNITTGLDGNGDLIFNDRPDGTTRNSVRTASQYTWSLNTSYGIPVRKARLTLTLNATNLTNHANLTGYSGVMTSPFFLQPTAVANVRRIDFGIGVSF